MTNGLKKYDVHLWDDKNQVLSDTFLSTDNQDEALYLAQELQHLCFLGLVFRYDEINGEKVPYTWSEVYDNEAEDNIYEDGRNV